MSQIRTIDKKRLVIPVLTKLSLNLMRQIDEAIRNSLAIDVL
ncbi:hypothetical protein GMMP15_390056 [Candidatus Magnetomoraceae bacterium gMMP-15]